jgi:hypothetical protein
MMIIILITMDMNMEKVVLPLSYCCPEKTEENHSNIIQDN